MADSTDPVGHQFPSTPTVPTDSRDVHRGFHPPERQGLGTTLTLLLAEIAEKDSTAIAERLGASLDVEALDALFSPRPDGSDRGPGVVEFDLAEYAVSVYSDGDIVIEEL